VNTQFITFEVALQRSPALQQAILTQLQGYGSVLRWAIAAVNPDRQTATIEAVILTP
jgi:hypothetical protein